MLSKHHWLPSSLPSLNICNVWFVFVWGTHVVVVRGYSQVSWGICTWEYSGSMRCLNQTQTLVMCWVHSTLWAISLAQQFPFLNSEGSKFIFPQPSKYIFISLQIILLLKKLMGMHNNVHWSTFAIVKLLTQPRSTTEEWIKMWHIYTMEYYSASKENESMLFFTTWVELEGIILRKISPLRVRWASPCPNKVPAA